MACNSEKDTVFHLRHKKSVIDNNNNVITDKKVVDTIVERYNMAAREDYGVMDNLLIIEDNFENEIKNVEKSVRNTDGSRKRYLNYNTAINKVKKLNFANSKYKFTVGKVMGEKGDSRVYYAVFANPVNNAGRYTLKFNSKAFSKIDKIKEERNNRNKEESKGGYDLEPDFMVFSMPTTDTMTPNFTKYRQYKMNQIKRLEKSLNRVKFLKKEAKENLAEYKRLTALEDKLDKILNGDAEKKTLPLKERLEDMDKAGFLGHITDTILEDLKIAEDLIAIGSFDNLIAARETIDFYRSFIDFDVRNTTHPLFTWSEDSIVRKPDGTLSLGEELESLIGLVSIPLQKLTIDLDVADKKLINDHVSNYSKVINLDLETDWETLFPNKGMKDIGIFDMFFMDITNGLTSTNGLIPQYMASYLGDKIAQSSYKSRVIVETLDKKDKTGRSLQERVTKKLRSLGKEHRINGVFSRGASFNFFRQKDENGNYTGGILQRYSYDFYSKLFSANTEYHNARIGAFKSKTPSLLLGRASKEHRKWLKENVEFIDSSKFAEVYSILGELLPSSFDTDWESRVSSKVGDKHFKEVKEQVIHKAKEYKVKHELYVENLLAEEGITDIKDLSVRGQNRLTNFEQTNNPILTSQNYYKETKKDLGTLAYNVMIPKMGSKDYDEDYKVVENDKDLSDFYDILKKFREQIDGLDSEAQNKIFKRGIPSMEQSLLEIFSDPNTKALAKLSKIYSKIIKDILDLFREIKQNESNVGLVNPLTGKPDYKVSSDFLKSNQEEINIVTDTHITKLLFVLGRDMLGSTTVDFETLTPKQKSRVFGVLQSLYGVSSEAELRKRLPNEDFRGEIDIKKLIRAGAKHRVIADESMDIPKIIKFYTKMISEYEARTLALPMLQSIKERYDKVTDIATTKEGRSIKNVIKGAFGREDIEEERQGVIGKRANAVKQMDSWFQRAVLGNYGSKSEIGDLTLNNNALDKREKEILKLLEEQEKDIKEELERLNENLKDADPFSTETIKKDINNLQRALVYNEKRQEKLGKQWSMKKAIDSLFLFNRFRGLGYNINSYLTNFFEGQTANIFTDASGDYFKPGTIYRANNIVKGSLLAGKIKPKGARLARVLMDRYDILQDAANELQRASRKSVLSKTVQNFTPYAGTQRVEYLNQTPLMISILLSTEIKGKDDSGKEIVSNVWDAMKEDGTLKKEFDNKENNNNWVDGLGQKYLDTKAKIDKCIINTHGDYHQLKGNMASEYISGKAFLMFKRWLSRQLYQRFALVEQVDLEAGISDFKGRYISHDKISGMMHGAILGLGGLSLIGAGPVGLVVGGAVGFGRGLLSNRNSPIKLGAADSLKELAFLTGQMILNPFKYFVNNVVGKEIIGEGNYEKYLPSYSPRDIKNIRTNISEMSMTLLWVSAILMAKAALWDDDDETDDPKRMAHNLIMNRLQSLLGSLSLYSNPVELKTSLLDPAFFTLLEDIGKFGDKLHKFTIGEDILLGGPDAGRSGLWKQTKKTFFPSLLKDKALGFKGQTERQYKPTPYHSFFWGEEKIFKNKNKELRAVYRVRLKDQGLEKELIDAAVKKRYPPKDKSKNQKEWYDEIKDNPAPSMDQVKSDLSKKGKSKGKGRSKKGFKKPSFTPKKPSFIR